MVKNEQMQDFFLIRHGQTDWNAITRQFQGHTNIPLNETGRFQASSMIKIFDDLQITRLISSDLIRAFETAEIMSQKKLPLEATPDLREVHLGKAEGLTREQVADKFGVDFYPRWSSHAPSHQDLRFEGGESRREVHTRIDRILHHYLDLYPNDRLAFVSHGFAIQSLIYNVSDQNQAQFFVPNCAIAPFQRSPQKKIHYIGPRTPEELLCPNG